MSSIEPAPAFRLDSTRTHLHQAREYAPASSAAELFADALLDELAARVRIGVPKKPLSPVDVADVVEAAEQAAKLAAEKAVCACGHRWTDHVGRAGCMECDCRGRRPLREVSRARQVLPSAAEVARAYDDEDRHYPQAGAR